MKSAPAGVPIQTRVIARRGDWTARAWERLGSERLYAEHGLLYTKDLAVWASGCVRCHAGALDANLAAAGHPRLRPFELFTHGQGQPRHWRDYTGAKPVKRLPAAGPAHAARVWFAGQAAALARAAEMLAELAERPGSGEEVPDAVERA